jgi:SpoIID/LytB domain protein
VVNDVDLEGYLKGVLAKELLRDWHEEAYRAQAIVARTYALYEMKTAGTGGPGTSTPTSGARSTAASAPRTG